ncbi:MAG: high-potential iron-sulfur protein [Gammaproteobacteria bacterium]
MDETRRRWLQQLAWLAAASTVGCERKDAQTRSASLSSSAAVTPGATPPPGRASCDDTSGLTPEQIKLRRELKYVDRAPNPAHTCGSCNHIQPAPGSNDPCKRCSVVPGPVHLDGWCSAWVARIGGGS